MGKTLETSSQQSSDSHDSALASIAKRFDLAELSVFDTFLLENFADPGWVDIIFAWGSRKDVSLDRLTQIEDALVEIFQSEIRLTDRDLLMPEYRELFLKHRRIIYANDR